MAQDDTFEEDKDLATVHNQDHGCWCPGDVNNHGISCHDIDLVILEYFGFHNRCNTITKKKVL